MSGPRRGDGKEEAQVDGGDGGGGSSYLEDGQCDSGLGSIRSLHSQLGEGEPRSPAARGGTPPDKGPDPPPGGKEAPADAEERLDSSYGSSSLVESLAGLNETPVAPKEDSEEDSEGERFRRQLRETFAFMAEEGDT